MRRIVLLLGVVAGVLPFCITSAASPTPQPVGSPGLANFNILPGTQPPPGQPVKRFFSYALAPGQSLADKVMVVNPSKTSPLTVRLSISDALTPPRGGGMTFNDARTQRQVGRWIHLSVAIVTVGPYQVAYVPLALQVPSSARPGEYIGTVNATDVQPATITSGKIGIHVYLNRRCMVLLRVTGHAVVGLQIKRVAVTQAGKRTVLGFVLQNTGTVIDYPVATVVAFRGLMRSYALRPIIGMVMGGDSTALALAIDHAVSPGTYQASIHIVYLATPTPAAPAQNLTIVWSGRLVVPHGSGT